MPRKRKVPSPEPPEGGPVITDALLDRFAPNRPLTGEEVEAASRRFKKALIERALGARILRKRSPQRRGSCARFELDRVIGNVCP